MGFIFRRNVVRSHLPDFLQNRCMVVSFNLLIPISRSKRKDGLRAPAPSVRCDRFARVSNAPNDAALLTYSCPRYQHLDIYLRKPSEKPSTSPLPVAEAAAPNTASPPALAPNPSAPGKGPARSPATGLPGAGAFSDETALAPKQQKQHQLPAIDFSGELELPRQSAPGDRGGGRGGAKPPPKPSERQAVSPARGSTSAGGGGGGGDEDAMEEGEDSGEETTSVDGEEDFLALPAAENAECDRGESGSGATESEVRLVSGPRQVGLWL